MKKRLITLINPQLCEGCRFCELTTLFTEDSIVETVVSCKRKDCDNWDTQSSILIEINDNIGL